MSINYKNQLVRFQEAQNPQVDNLARMFLSQAAIQK